MQIHRLVHAFWVLAAGAVVDDDLCTNNSCSTHLLQAKAGLAAIKRATDRDLVLMHIPYNFGHTMEVVAALPVSALDLISHPEGFSEASLHAEVQAGNPAMSGIMKAITQMVGKNDKEIWGRLDPQLGEISNITGCRMYFTPPKYWPADLAERYFGNKKVFGLFRNPYERLVSEFRGNFKDYGGSIDTFHDSCDINAGVQDMLKTYMNGDRYASGCTLLPQTEYVDMPHGVTVPVDLHEFPNSMNEVLSKHGYDIHIRTQDILHVRSCDDVWAGDLNNETRALVKQVYKRDFEFLCETFGYCDQDESMCLQNIPHMCPEKLFVWDDAQQKYQRRTG